MAGRDLVRNKLEALQNRNKDAFAEAWSILWKYENDRLITFYLVSFNPC